MMGRDDRGSWWTALKLATLELLFGTGFGAPPVSTDRFTDPQPEAVPTATNIYTDGNRTVSAFRMEPTEDFRKEVARHGYVMGLETGRDETEILEIWSSESRPICAKMGDWIIYEKGSGYEVIKDIPFRTRFKLVR